MLTTSEIQEELHTKLKNLEVGWKRSRSNSVSPISGRKKDEFDFKAKYFKKRD